MFINEFENTKRINFNLEEPNKYYIYFLKELDNIVYVGLTTSLYRRISFHVNDKIFDTVEYLEVPANNATFIEYYFIKKYLPKYNKNTFPINGYGSFESLKRPPSFQKQWLKKFIYVYDLKPLALINSERFFSQEYFEKKWTEIYGSYRILTKSEKKDLNKAYEKLDIEKMDSELK